MKKHSREAEWKPRPNRTVGVDLGDRCSRYCVLNEDGEVMEEGRIGSSAEAFGRHFEGEPRQRVVLETGTENRVIMAYEAEKEIAGRAAAKLVNDGDIVGLGTGSTAYFAVIALGERVKAGLKIIGIPTSVQTADLARTAGIRLT